MTTARKEIVLKRTESTYHCVSRCVRRAFLCGFDSFSGNSYEHRKLWIKNRLKELSEVFGIDVCGYSVMSNHLHLVLRTRPLCWMKWSDETVALRWWKLFPRRRNEDNSPAEPSDKELEVLMADKDKLKILRERLGDISWFMRCLNENIARRANEEDGCTGRFWEGRFKCTVLLDEAAELACMAYVDLNPIRAKIAETPEKSEFTSVKDRIDAKVAKDKIKKFSKEQDADKPLTVPQLEAIAEVQKTSEADQWLNPIGIRHYKSKDPRKGFLSIKLDEYLSLIDWTGRSIRSGKRGKIPNHLKPILTRLNIDVDNWVNTVKSFGRTFYRVAGKIENIIKRAKKAGQAFFHGKRGSELAFGPPV